MKFVSGARKMDDPVMDWIYAVPIHASIPRVLFKPVVFPYNPSSVSLTPSSRTASVLSSRSSASPACMPRMSCTPEDQDAEELGKALRAMR